MGFLSGIKFGAGVILGLIGAIVLLAVLVALITPEKPAPHAEPVTQELTSASHESNAPTEHAEEAPTTEEATTGTTTEPECGVKDGVCPKGCTGLLDEDCVLSADQKWVLENGIGVWIESAKFEECVDPDNEKKYYIVVKVHAENKGTDYKEWVIGFMDTSIILDGKSIEPEPVGPSFKFMLTTCETKYEDAEDASITKLAPGTSAEAYIVFDVTKFGDVRGKDIKFVWDPDTFKKGDEVVWKLQVS